MMAIGGCGLFWAYFCIACIICYKNPFNPSMLKPFIKFIQSYASQTEQKNKDVLIYMSIVSLPGFIFILLTGKACAIKFVYSVFN